jgi:hypothetical protein
VKPRAQAKRAIDFKAGLSPQADRMNSKLRDVIAVFSQSQLHCLGLAAFLARAKRDHSGFIVLDDPILASDDDHRAHFIHSAIDELSKAGIQVILLTQDQATRRDIESLYSHLGIDVFQITLDDPVLGTVVVKTSDTLSEMLARSKPYLRNPATEMRKRAAEMLRDTAERLCKEMHLSHRRKSGEPGAALTEYDGKTLTDLIPMVDPLLNDPSHPGKLRVMSNHLNKGKHDHHLPSNAELSICHGNIGQFKKMYLC